MSEVSKSFNPKTINYRIGVKQIEYDERARIISVQWQEGEGVVRVNIPLTPTELVIIKALLEASYQREVDLEQKIHVQRSTSPHEQSGNHSIAKKHIGNMRSKL